MGRSKEIQEILDSYSEVENLENLLTWAENLKSQIRNENHPQAQKVCDLIQLLTDEAKQDEGAGRDYDPAGCAFDITREIAIGYQV